MNTPESLYAAAMAHAAMLCAITPDNFAHSRTEAAVDARILVVDLMIRRGHTEATLCRITGWSQQRINYLRNAAACRLRRRIFRAAHADLARHIDTLFPED